MARQIPTIEVPKVANIPPGNITETEWVEQRVTTDVLAALRFDPAHPSYGAVRGTADSAQQTANTNAINAAAEDARVNGGVLVMRGEFHTNDTVVIRCNTDAIGASLITPNTITPAVRVGTNVSGASDHRLTVVLPRILTTKTTGSAWSSGIGVEMSNLNSCHVTVHHVQNFGTGVLMSALGQGNAYNYYYMGHINNNKVNLHINPGVGGWFNENTIDQGRYSHYQAEGTNVAGTRHILISSNGVHPVNNNVFIKPSIEGLIPEFHIDMTFAYDNRFINARYEANPPKVRMDACVGTVFDGGYNAPAIVFTELNASRSSHFISRVRRWFRLDAGPKGAIVIENYTSSQNPALVVMRSGAGFSADLETEYNVQLGALYTRFKASTDAHPRIEIEAGTGRIKMGEGTGAPASHLSANQFGNFVMEGGDLFVGGALVPNYPEQSGARIYAGSGDPNGSQSASPGSMFLSSSGTIYRKSTGTGNTGWVAMS